ncbi:hypothetical protein Strain138_002059 [Pseudogemmatithrix spongiicola]|uniref:Proteinase inhibitor I42 chagasin domain-containing protein n=1 Tax=Pseudogemmatithrix spongiicola TaxID=3062599 RepID=A0AA49Q635_9BACT|nr:hypothetical protein Strain138_002059 [Gemmatimonadaceae bacterium 'strain 138']WKW15657.1 hypothetical protein Strain318_002058 [Gemmatimonadaceae bacterium 'strain 318']
MPLSAVRRRAFAVFAAAALAACAAEPGPSEPLQRIEEQGPIVATVQAESAAPGAVVAVRFTNTVASEFWFNPCERSVQRLEGESWSTPIQEMRLCNSMAYILQPNGERTEDVDVPAGLAQGTYRFVFTMRAPQTPDVAHRPASTSFVVR